MKTLLTVVMALTLAAVALAAGPKRRAGDPAEHITVAIPADLPAKDRAILVKHFADEAGVIVTNTPSCPPHIMADAAGAKWEVFALWAEHVKPTYDAKKLAALTNTLPTVRAVRVWDKPSATLADWRMTNTVSGTAATGGTK